MSSFQKHHSQELGALFQAKPFQGQDPEKAKVIILGNDANYSEEISEQDFFKFILEYHVDGVKFWKKYGVHHPFLLENYPLNKTGGGVPYHRNFSKLGYTSEHAEIFSFVELLNIPTIGVTSTNLEEFWGLINIEHLKWLESIMLSKEPKIFFLSRSVLQRLQEIAKKYNIFSWLSDTKLEASGLQAIYQKDNTSIFVSYSFSASQIHGVIDSIRATIDDFLKKKDFKSSIVGSSKTERLPESEKIIKTRELPSVVETKISPNPPSYDCPVCNSKSTKRTSLVWVKGQSRSKRKTSGLGAIFFGKRTGVMGGSMWSTTDNQSKLSELTAPPTFFGISDFLGAILVCFLIFPFILALFGIPQETASLWGKNFFIFATIFMVIDDIFVYPSQKRNWDASFFCNRCSAQYIPGGKILKQ